MRILITGGAGFIGSHLCEYYLEKDHQVICMDNLLTGSLDNIGHLFSNRAFTFINYNITNYLYTTGPLDAILHFASPASPADYLKFPLETLTVGSVGTYHGLGLARAKGAKFLLASTSEVYGDPLEHPQKEEYFGNVNPIGPRGVYDEAKRFAEAIVMAYYRRYQMQTRIVRIFNTYGPRMRIDDGRVIPAFIPQALQGENLTVFGDGSQTRSFCFVDDLVKGIALLLELDYHEPVNLGNPSEISILDFAQEIIDICHSPSKLTFKELPEGDPKVRQPDITRAKELLGWTPQVDRKEGLKKTVDYFRKKLNLSTKN